jgi:OOP family OmpA-OmpF porin
MPILLAVLVALAPQAPWDMAKQAAGKATTGKLEGEINKRLLAESRKNQCSFKTDTDVLDKGCDKKLRNLAGALIDAKKKLDSAHVQNFKFEVSGHTDSSGNAAHNKELSEKRAAVIAKELQTRGVPKNEIVAVGKGAQEPVVKPDNTAAKKAKNRRYEVRVRL